MFSSQIQGKRNAKPFFAAMIVLLAGASTALAVPSQPLPTAQSADILIVDPFNGGPATAAAGAFSGNDKPTNALTLLNDDDVFNTGLTWSFAGSSDDDDSGPFTGSPETTAGLLGFDDPISGPFVISLKASNAFGLYYFENPLGDVSLLSFITSGVGVNKHGRAQGLSHASLFTANSLPPINQPIPPQQPVQTPPFQTPPLTGIPEPTTATLALIGIAAMLRRRRASE